MFMNLKDQENCMDSDAELFMGRKFSTLLFNNRFQPFLVKNLLFELYQNRNSLFSDLEYGIIHPRYHMLFEFFLKQFLWNKLCKLRYKLNDCKLDSPDLVI